MGLFLWKTLPVQRESKTLANGSWETLPNVLDKVMLAAETAGP